MEKSIISVFNNDAEKSAVEFIKGEPIIKVINQPELVIKKGLVKGQAEYTKWLNAFAREFCRQKLKSIKSDDKVLMQSSEALNELDRSLNIYYERLSEMYGLYWPEAVNESTSIKKLISFIDESSKRPIKNFGFNISDYDLSLIKLFANKVKEVLKLRMDLEEYVNKRVTEIAPGLSKEATPLIAAKLITLAKGLANLARMPSSTIQVLGAEKALFRHLRKGTKPPKYGVIMQHQNISSAKAKEKGKAARRLANKIAIAARGDYYEK